jgi:hypothetical protein
MISFIGYTEHGKLGILKGGLSYGRYQDNGPEF